MYLNAIAFIPYIIVLATLFQEITSTFFPQNMFCQQKIYMDFQGLTTPQIDFLCNQITQNSRFVILLTTSYNFMDNYSYTLTTQNFLQSQCAFTYQSCDYVYAIAVYANVGKVIITSGRFAKASSALRAEAINTMIVYLKSGDYYNALNRAVTMLGNSEITVISGGGSTTTTVTRSSFGFFSVLIFIICPIICILCICYFACKKQADQELDSPLVGEPGNSVTSGIHFHLCQLEDLIKEIRKSSPPIISINKCLICMQQITVYPPINQPQSQYIEMKKVNVEIENNAMTPSQTVTVSINQNAPVDDNNTRFACQHVYHTKCLALHRLSCCLMCNENINSRETVPNTIDTQVIDEGHIKAFIKNLNFLYDQKELNEYATYYPSEYDTFNTTLLLGLGTAWGIGLGSQTVYVNNYNYNYGTNDIYGQNPIQGGNQQYAIGGMYEPPMMNDNNNNIMMNNNVEMNTIEGNYNNGEGFNNQNNNQLIINTGNYNNNNNYDVNTATFGESSNGNNFEDNEGEY